MRALIRSLPNRIGGTVFVSSHMLAEVEQVADYVGLMRTGRLALQDTVQALIGGGRSIRIELGKEERGAMMLRAAGFDAAGCGRDVLRLRCSGRDDVQAQAGQANRLLIEAGFRVSAVTPEMRMLEDVYRETLVSASTERQAA